MSHTTTVKEEQQRSRGHHCQHHPDRETALTGRWYPGPGGSACLLLQAPHSQEQQECFILHLKYAGAETAQQILLLASPSPQSLVFCSLIASQQHSNTIPFQPRSVKLQDWQWQIPTAQPQDKVHPKIHPYSSQSIAQDTGRRAWMQFAVTGDAFNQHNQLRDS